MWKLIAAGLGMVGASIVGIFLGDRWARESIAERLLVMQQVVEQSRGAADRRMAGEALAVARHLRDDDLAGALELVEATIERQRTTLAADAGTPRATGLDGNLLKLIGEYQASYPWSPAASSPQETELAARFGRFAPHIQGGVLIGFRVDVQPGSVLAEIGLINGDIVTDYDGQPVALDRSPSLFETLQSGRRVNLMVQSQDGKRREFIVPQR